MHFFERVYEIVCRIPKGKVATYGQVACLAGNSRSSRIVGYALHQNPKPGIVPCHRVVNKQGRLASSFAFGGMEVQKKLLEKEGVIVSDDGFVDMNIYRCSIEDLYVIE